MPPLLPQSPNFEVPKRRIGGYERNVFDFGLCSEHPVERIAVVALHHSGMARVLKAERQRLEAEGGQDIGEIVRQRLRRRPS